MDNITHTLVGIALADFAMKGKASTSQRRLPVGAGIIAANLPDIDLVYAGITQPAPLGYLLHHRGHTHTVAGLVALAIGLMAVYRLLPAVRKMRFVDRSRFWLLIAAALASHVLLDALNSYGVHPFYPVDDAWYFGDALFIFEPWLWVLLGIAAAWNAQGRFATLAAWLPVVILPIALASARLIPADAAAALGIFGGMFAAAARGWSPRVRAAVALMASLLLIAGSLKLSAVAKDALAESLAPEIRGRLVDLILTPNPSSPLCWAAIGIELDEGMGRYVLRGGTLSLAPGWKAPTACASHRFAGSRAVRLLGGGRFALTDEIHRPLGPLRALARTNCYVREWLRFGRAPVIAGGNIFDLRFSNRVGQNFSYMALHPEGNGRGCPRFVPEWKPPRGDLLAD